MKSKKAVRRRTKAGSTFDAQTWLTSAGVEKQVTYAGGEVIFAQGDPCGHVMYIRTGAVRLSVLSMTGREAVVAVLGPGDFFGEGCLAGQRFRIGSATAISPSTVLRVAKRVMVELLHKQQAMSDRFITHMLARNIQIEGDLIDQLFNSSEKRLARALLLLARYGTGKRIRMAPNLSQETLAAMVGTTRSRVNFFLNKFRRLGFVEYDSKTPLTVNSSLLSVVLHD